MNWTTIGIGMAAMAYGVATIVLRQTRPHLFRKLQPMKQFWGEKAGFWIHVVGYSVFPILIGVFLVSTGIRGGGLF
jgi:dolichol kinase